MRISDLLLAATQVAVCVHICSANFSLNATCSPPVTQGGKGYCGPSFCDSVVNPKPACIFGSQAYNYAEIIQRIPSKTCIQSTDPRCTTAALTAVMKGQGIKAAYCNDEFLVIHSDGTTGFSDTLKSVKNPPASISSDGTACVTRSTNPSYLSVKIPLNPSLLDTSDPLINNVNSKSFPKGAGDSGGAYMSTSTMNTAATYGLPTRGPVGITIAGEEIFPAFNNLATLAPQKCEVDSCNQHVGGGGGQPHLHGDPFGAWCLYSALNYSSSFVHPPQIGWGFDGPSIYGRYLLTSNAGASVVLDSCGGHVHGSYAYHYHAQVLTSTTDSGAYPGQAAGQTYYASTTGPYKCLKGDISLITNYWGSLLPSYTSVLPDTTKYICSGTTNFYVATGIIFPGSQSSSLTPSPSFKATSLSTSSSPTVSPSTTKTPSKASSVIPSSSPTQRPSIKPVLPPTLMPSSTKPVLSPTLLPSSANPVSPPTLTPSSTKPISPPTVKPSKLPSRPPTLSPTLSPSRRPSLKPTAGPSKAPSKAPSNVPTQAPRLPAVASSATAKPSGVPSKMVQ